MMKIQKPMISSTGRKFSTRPQKPGPVLGRSRITSTFLLTSWSTSLPSIGPTTWPSVPSLRL